jgi:hypothetical protein
MQIYKVTTNFSAPSGGLLYNSLHFGHDRYSQAQDARDAAAAFWSTLTGIISSEISWQTDTTIYTIDDATGQVVGADEVPSTGDSGDNDGEPLPWASQGLLTLNTGVYYGGRRLKGRIFVPGPCEAQNTNGAPNASYYDPANVALAGLIDNGVRVFSPTHLRSNEAIGGATWGKWASLRSRRD